MRLSRHPAAIALVLAVGAMMLFAIGLGRPAGLVFDESHYVPAARTLLALDGPANIEHPLLGKLAIAIGIALFGDGPIGWRAMGVLAGGASVAGAFALAWLATRNLRTATLGGYLVAINQTLLVQARTAMLDIYLGAFVLWGAVALVWAMTGPVERRGRRAALAGVSLGCAVAVKWAAVPYVALACAVALAWPRPAGWRQRLAAPLLLGGVAVAVYLASFAPAFFYAGDALTLPDLIPLQARMLARQTQILAPHNYQSGWASWPLMLRPIWYYYERDAGIMRGVLLIGNPVVMWGGLVAVGAGLVRARGPTFALAGLWLFSVVIYAIIPKSLGFYYYYHLSGIFIALVLAAMLPPRRGAPLWAAAAATVAFAWFYPILSGAPLADEQAFTRWMWFDSWR